jgi:hypothetical protein
MKVFKFSVTKFNDSNKPTVWSVRPITQTSTLPLFHENKNDALRQNKYFTEINKAVFNGMQNSNVK